MKTAVSVITTWAKTTTTKTSSTRKQQTITAWTTVAITTTDKEETTNKIKTKRWYALNAKSQDSNKENALVDSIQII